MRMLSILLAVFALCGIARPAAAASLDEGWQKVMA